MQQKSEGITSSVSLRAEFKVSTKGKLNSTCYNCKTIRNRFLFFVVGSRTTSTSTTDCCQKKVPL